MLQKQEAFEIPFIKFVIGYFFLKIIIKNLFPKHKDYYRNYKPMTHIIKNLSCYTQNHVSQ
jgi:hypothetical protein